MLCNFFIVKSRVKLVVYNAFNKTLRNQKKKARFMFMNRHDRFKKVLFISTVVITIFFYVFLMIIPMEEGRVW